MKEGQISLSESCRTGQQSRQAREQRWYIVEPVQACLSGVEGAQGAE